jgi:glycosyltransferase involved in cell wall biosynthesis
MMTLNVSVVIPCYNTAQTIKRCLDSVMNQSALPREIILVDDGSDQPIEPLIALWRDDIHIPIHVLRQPNQGAAAARNAGIRLSRGQYIAFLDADDIWLPNKLKIQFEVMQRMGLTISGHGYRFESKTLVQGIPAQTLEGIKIKMAVCYRQPFFYPNRHDQQSSV